MSIQNSHQVSDVKVMLVKGADGSGIATIEKTSTSGNVDTYTITLEDGSKSTFTVTNGTSIASIEKTSTSGVVDTYTITLTDGTTYTFTVTNGDDTAMFETFNVASTDWVSNPDSTTSASYPYVATIATTDYSNTSHPVWQMNGTGTLPTTAEREQILKILEMTVNATGITLYANALPSVNLVLEVRGR